MTASEGNRYSMKAASRLTGLTPDTLRAWERRYEAVVPSREAKGRRVYSAGDIDRLMLLKQATELGHPIRQVAPLSNAALGALLEDGEERAGKVLESGTPIDRLMAAIDQKDLEQFERVLGWMAAALIPSDLINQVIGPLLTEVGNRWHAGEMSIAEEHAVSGIVRNFIGSIIRLYPHRGETGGVALATVSGERHEFGILMLHLLSVSKGTPTLYLGPDLPHEEIIRATLSTHCRLLAMSAVNMPDELQLHAYREIARGVAGKAEFLVGGAMAHEVVENIRDLPIRCARSIDDFERQLRLLDR